MADQLVVPEDGAIEVLPIHFDVPNHYIPLKTFIQTANQAEGVVASLNTEWFAGELEYEVVVVPPRPGSLLVGLGVAVVTITVAGWKFLHSEIGKAFVCGLTGKEPAHWAKHIGERIRSTVSSEHIAEELTDVPKLEANDEESAPPEIRNTSTSIILVESTKAILTKDAGELRRVGVDPEHFREALEARNEFYRACWEEDELRAIGFDETDTFPISRKDFVQLQVPLGPREETLEEEPSTVEITMVTVSSPNWDRGDASRMWRGKDATGRYRNFKMTDEGFWSLATQDQLVLHGQDTMKVQWAFQGDGAKRKNYRVLRVLEYNGEHLSDPLDGDALDAILGPYRAGEEDQDDLFGQ